MVSKYWTTEWNISILRVGQSIEIPLTGPSSLSSFVLKFKPKRFQVRGRVVKRLPDGDYRLGRSRTKNGKVVEKRRGSRK